MLVKSLSLFAVIVTVELYVVYVFPFMLYSIFVTDVPVAFAVTV